MINYRPYYKKISFTGSAVVGKTIRVKYAIEEMTELMVGFSK
ncbi:MAG TPA: hypothetical protein VNS08_11865 [Ureibacillus sp.]|nr:hypothetical protein [Ureibacillus sp.]